jgi:hypothetical protein
MGVPALANQMKTLRAIAALVALEARIADVAGQEQPDPRQGDAGLRRKTSNDGLQYILQIALGGYGDGKTQKAVIFHQRPARLYSSNRSTRLKRARSKSPGRSCGND